VVHVRLTRLVLATALASLAGCGGGDRPDTDQTPPPAARAAAVAFVRDVADGNGAGACAIATRELVADLQTTAAGGYRPTASTAEARLKQVQAAHVKARTCAGAMGLLSEQAGDARLARLLARVRTLPIQWAAPESMAAAQLGNQEWVMTRDGDRWRLMIANGLMDALPDV
jgi:hypothetical protein